MRATMYGCEIVWPWPIGSAPSSYAGAGKVCGHELLARHGAHRAQDLGIVDAALLELIGGPVDRSDRCIQRRRLSPSRATQPVAIGD